MKNKTSLILALALVATLMAGMSASAHSITPGGAPKFQQAGTQAATAAASDNPYLVGIQKRANQTYDTTKFKKNPPYKIALASQGPTNSWATLFDAHARYEVDKLGKDVISELLYADANGSADKQVPQVEDLLSQNPDALILVPMGSAALSAPVERVMAAGVPVILCASPVDTDDFVTEIGTDLYRRGTAEAEWLVQQLGGKGNIVQMDGIAGVGTAEQGKLGAEDTWKKYPGIKVLDAQYGNWSTAEAKKLMEQWLAKYGDEIQGIWSNGAQMSQGIISAYLDAKKPIPPLAGGEYMNGFLRMAAENKVSFYAVQYPPSMSMTCVDVAVQILKGEPVKRFIDFRETIKEGRDFTDKDIADFYNPKWSDDVFGPVFLPDAELEKLGYLKK
jgi:ribose transport system substrate-binding protein